MDNSNNPSNRLYLNFNSGDNKYQPGDSRTYPTTPSTFPNPVFPGQQQSQQQQAPQSYQQQQQPYSAGGNAPSGYFMNNTYAPSYPQQPSNAAYQAPQAPQASYQQRSNAPLNDATNGLVHQFSHQNLGGGRQSPYGQQRQPSPAQRPRTAGASGQQPSYGYMNAPMPPPAVPQQTWPEFQPAPQRDSDRYGPNAQNNNTKCKTLAEAFFKDSVKRARDRNLR